MTKQAQELQAKFVTMPLTRQFEVGEAMGFISKGWARIGDMAKIQDGVHKIIQESVDADLTRLEGEMAQ